MSELTRQDYFEQLYKGDLTTIAKVEILRREDESVINEITSDVLSGSLTINKNNGVRRSLDITLSNIESKYKVDKYNIWVGSKVKLFLGVKIGNQEYYEEQGIFMFNVPSDSSASNEKTFSFSALDKFCTLDGQYSGNLQDFIEIANGTNVNTAINNIFTSEAILGIGNLDPQTPKLEPTDITLSYTLRKERGDTVFSIFDEIANYSSRNIYYNRFGKLTFEEDIDDTTKGSKWDFNFDKDTKSYISSNRTHNLDKIFNSIKVVGDDINGNYAVAVAKNENPLSPTNINLIGEKFAPVIDDTRITSNDLAEKRADFELKKLTRLNSSINISCLPLYHLDVDDVITVTDANLGLYKERFVIQSISFSLTNELMSITATNVRELGFDIIV